jgi:hypothetical protein
MPFVAKKCTGGEYCETLALLGASVADFIRETHAKAFFNITRTQNFEYELTNITM